MLGNIVLLPVPVGKSKLVTGEVVEAYSNVGIVVRQHRDAILLVTIQLMTIVIF